jgi:hypothetical protein
VGGEAAPRSSVAGVTCCCCVVRLLAVLLSWGGRAVLLAAVPGWGWLTRTTQAAERGVVLRRNRGHGGPCRGYVPRVIADWLRTRCVFPLVTGCFVESRFNV